VVKKKDYIKLPKTMIMIKTKITWNLLSSKEPDSKVVGKKEETNLQHTIRGIQI